MYINNYNAKRLGSQYFVAVKAVEAISYFHLLKSRDYIVIKIILKGGHSIENFEMSDTVVISKSDELFRTKLELFESATIYFIVPEFQEKVVVDSAEEDKD